MWVVKCGGSLAGSARLRDCLRVLADHTAGVIVIAGGGVFADRVREQQPILGYGDEAAHRMALLAMDQFACCLHELEPRLVLATSIDGAAEAARSGAAALLQASADLARAPLPASWAVTSDSLAGYVARRVNADDLLLLKARGIDRQEASAAVLCRDGYVDAAFADVIRNAAFEVWCQGPDPAQLIETLNAPGPPASRIRVDRFEPRTNPLP